MGPFQDAAFALPGKRGRYFATHIFFLDKFCKKEDKLVLFCYIITRNFFDYLCKNMMFSYISANGPLATVPVLDRSYLILSRMFYILYLLNITICMSSSVSTMGSPVYTDPPIKTKFGYHIIMVEGKK